MIALDLAVILALIAINGALALSEMALVSSRKHRLSQRAEAGNHGAAAAFQLAEEPTRFFSTVQTGITLVAIISGAYGGATLGSDLKTPLQELGLSEGRAESFGVIIAVVGITYLSLVFGEIVPKRIALSAPETLASLVSRPMMLLAAIGTPFVAVLSFSTKVVLKLLRIPEEPKETITEEEIRLMISMSAESGSVAEQEAELLERVFHFGDHRVREAMTPRNLAVGVEQNATVGEFYTIFANTPHARFPVFDNSLDNVIGVLVIKDVLAAVSRGEAGNDDPIRPLVRDCIFVPESKPAADLFREMQADGSQMAIVVDEFGGTAGIVTLEQILEDMVGQVGDELAGHRAEVTRLADGTLEVSGGISVERVRELGVEIPEGEYETLAGYVLDLLGRIPSVGDTVEAGHDRIAVLEMDNVKIERLRIARDVTSGRPA